MTDPTDTLAEIRDIVEDHKDDARSHETETLCEEILGVLGGELPPQGDHEPTLGPWDWSPQQGKPGHCYQAQVWGADGDAIATIESYPDPQTANDRARLIAAAPRLRASLHNLVQEAKDAAGVLEGLGDDGDAGMLRLQIKEAENALADARAGDNEE